MASIYLVRRGEMWLNVWEQDSDFLPFVAGAACYATRKDAEVAASLFTGAEPVEFREVGGDTEAGAPTHLHVVFDGPPGPNGGQFVEVENDAGQSVHAGEWVRRDDGLWSLRLRVFCAGETPRPVRSRRRRQRLRG